MSLVHKNIVIRGRVQGVYFRASAKYKADQLEVKGMIKNESDGSVFAAAEGEDEVVASFIEWCRTGPPAAKVIGVEISDGQIQGYKSFDVIR